MPAPDRAGWATFGIVASRPAGGRARNHAHSRATDVVGGRVLHGRPARGTDHRPTGELSVLSRWRDRICRRNEARRAERPGSIAHALWGRSPPGRAGDGRRREGSILL